VWRLEKSCSQVGNLAVGEPVVGAGRLQSFLESPVLLGELVYTLLERGVLGGELLDGLAGDHLVEVPNLAHQLTDVLALSENFLLGAGEGLFGIEGSFTPSGLNSAVLIVRCMGAAGADYSSVLVGGTLRL
jgi:hypothetical protein